MMWSVIKEYVSIQAVTIEAAYCTSKMKKVLSLWQLTLGPTERGPELEGYRKLLKELVGQKVLNDEREPKLEGYGYCSGGRPV